VGGEPHLLQFISDSGCQYLEHNEKPFFQTRTETWNTIQCNSTGKFDWMQLTSGPQWTITHQRENVKLIKEIECCPYKSTATIFSGNVAFAPFIFSKTNWVIPRTFCTHNLSCYESLEGPITCSVTIYVPLVPIQNMHNMDSKHD